MSSTTPVAASLTTIFTLENSIRIGGEQLRENDADPLNEKFAVPVLYGYLVANSEARLVRCGRVLVAAVNALGVRGDVHLDLADVPEAGNYVRIRRNAIPLATTMATSSCAVISGSDPCTRSRVPHSPRTAAMLVRQSAWGTWAHTVPERSGPATYEFVSRTFGRDGSKYWVYSACAA